MKTIAIACLLLVGGCMAGAQPGFDAQTEITSAASTADVSTAHYAGSFGDAWVGCGAKVLQGGACSAKGGTIVTSELSTTPNTGAAWHCRVQPSDTTAGADMTVTVNCQ